MKLQLTAQLLAATLVVTSTVTLTTKSQANPTLTGLDTDSFLLANGGTHFECISQSAGNVATVGQRPGKEPVILFVWTPSGSNYFGEQYPPQTRCATVTSRLNEAVRNNGGKLSGVLMTTGQVKQQTVICVLNQFQKKCDGTNTLFTLKPENAKHAGDVLGQLLQIGRVGSSAGVITETSGEAYVDLGIVETALDESPNTQEGIVTPNVEGNSPLPGTPEASPTSNDGGL